MRTYYIMDESTENANDMIVINELMIYLEQCVANNRLQQSKNTIDRIIRLLELLKFNIDIMD